MQREIIFFLNFAFQTDSCREGSWSIQDLQPFALSSRHLSLDKLTWTGFFLLEGSWKNHLPFCSVAEWPEGLTWGGVWGSGLSFFSCGVSQQYAHPQECGCGSGLQVGLRRQVGSEQEIFHTLLAPTELKHCPKLCQSWADSQRGVKTGSD